MTKEKTTTEVHTYKDEDLDSIRNSCDVFLCVCVNIDILIYFVTCSEGVEY